MDLTLRYRFPKDRDHLGVCELINADGEVLYGKHAVLARSDNPSAKAAGNAKRDPLKKNGDLPLGRYGVLRVPASFDLRKFGPHPRFQFNPLSGPALQAMKNGRSGLMAHGGDINPLYAWWGGLRPTLGCVRHHNDDLACLHAVLDRHVASLLYADVAEQ